MAIRKIALMGNPVLRRRAREVEDPSAPAILRLVEDMLETLDDIEGAGLAAPQVHEPLRVVIFHVPAARAAEEEGGRDGLVPLTALVNPVVEPLTTERRLGWESCLSAPDLIGAVPRFTRIRYSGLTLDGGRIERIAEGFHARVVQHECDHLDGVLFPMRMTDASLLGFVEEVRRARPDLDGIALDGAAA